MGEGGEYKRTLFDRHGPAALDYIRVWAYGAMVFGIVVAAFTLRVGFKWWTIPVGFAAGATTGALGLFMAQSVGNAWKHLMIDGSATPYIEQYSAQQALVMQGKLDEALASFESVIKERGLSSGGRSDECATSGGLKHRDVESETSIEMGASSGQVGECNLTN